MNVEKEIQIWGGIECTINRVGNDYFDQSEYSGHYQRGTLDIDLAASLGITMLRYPVLWEKHQPKKNEDIDWSFAALCLNRLQEKGVQPIAGLVHHGSGPEYVNFYDGSFESGLEQYAQKVAQKFPWLEYYTPVNEPLTTARFCGLYGHWYPHGKSDYTFFKVLLSECKATVMAMAAIRKLNPKAKLVQTEDLGKCYSTPLLAYQAKMENHRRWLSYDLLCGRVHEQHYMWKYLIKSGIKPEEILYFRENHCVPHIAGFNYYITSERYLDENMLQYPECYHGGNKWHRYADIETVKVNLKEENGPAVLLREAYEHLGIPIAITECHLHSTREDQMRWFNLMWHTVNKVKEEGVDIRAITAWAIFGLTGWNRLCTQKGGDYEPGVFNVSSGTPRPTALARLLQDLVKHRSCHHPVLENEGWWQRDNRQIYGQNNVVSIKRRTKKNSSCRPLLVLGKTGTLGKAFSKICKERNIHHLLLSRAELDMMNVQAMEQAVSAMNPWGVINATGYVQVDEAEKDSANCINVNAVGPALLAGICREKEIRFLSLSTDLVFSGNKGCAYLESDATGPLNVYGQSKVMAEQMMLENNPEALVIRTSSFFGPWDNHNFVVKTLNELKENRVVKAAADVVVSPTYIPDLVQASLDLLLDGDTGIYHITNKGAISWAEWAEKIAIMAGCDTSLVRSAFQKELKWKATRPAYSVLQSEKGIQLPDFEDAMERCFEALGNTYQSGKIAV